MSNTTFALATALAVVFGASLAACGDQGFSHTHSYSARTDPNGTAADAAANNGSVSSSMEKQRQKVYGQY